VTAGVKYFTHPYFNKTGNPARYMATLSPKTAICAGCYQTLLNELQLEYSSSPQLTPASIVTSCKQNVTSASCLGSPYMVEKLVRFQQCSGYAIDFIGPVCTMDNMDAIAKNLTPVPYQLFVDCALKGWLNSQVCENQVITQFMKNLNTTVGEDCYQCFAEFKTAIEALIKTSSVSTACSTSITGYACRAALKDPLDSYKQCSGFDMLVETPIFYVPPPVDTNNTNTTKSAMMSSIIGALILAGLSIAL
jgi:hypothetical protein